MIKALLREYPHLDTMMAETLVWAHENGTLEQRLKDDEKPPNDKLDKDVKVHGGRIVVHDD